MLKTWFSEYKWILILVLLAAYSVFVWNVSHKVHDTEVARDRLRQAEQIIQIKEENDRKIAEISATMNKGLKDVAAQSTKHYKELSDAIAKDPRYSSCTVTDGVRDVYERKLESQ